MTERDYEEEDEVCELVEVEDGEEEEEEDDEDSLVDPLDVEREKCVRSYECQGFNHAFKACQSRVNDDDVKENCTPEFFDLLECRDKCVAKGDIFKILK